MRHDDIWRAIDSLAAENGLSASGLARRAGLDPTAFNPSKRIGPDGRARWPSTESVAKVLNATGAGIDAFAALVSGQAALPSNSRGPRPSRRVPLIGLAQAGGEGFFDDGGFPAGQGWDVVEFPAPPDRKAGVYALEVQGDSMLPLYRDGDVLIVEPGAQVRRGDRVVERGAGGARVAVHGDHASAPFSARSRAASGSAERNSCRKPGW